MEIVETKGGVGWQIYSTLCVNLLTISYGCSIGWLSPALEQLKGQNSPLASGPISTEESSFVGSASCVGGFIASCIYGWIAEKYGRKKAMISLAVPQMIGWILIYFATNPIYLILSRFLNGFVGGGVFIVVPIFVTEISEDRIRGQLGAQLVGTMCIGILIGYVLGDILSFKTMPLCLLMITNLFLAGVILIHDPPMYLLRKSRFRHAEDSLKFYRGFRKDKSEINIKLKEELDNMTCMIKMSNCNSADSVKVSTADFLTRPAIKAMLISIVLMFLEFFSGTYALLSYASMIFDSAGSSLSPNNSAIIVGVIQVVGVYISSVLVDRAGRKILMVSSAFCCAIGLTLFSAYDFFKNEGIDVDDYNWIPLMCFSIVIFSANLGVVNLPFMIMTEISPLKIKDIIYSINVSFSWVLAYLAVQFLPLTIAALGLNGTLIIFAAGCFLGAIYLIINLPETKNKSIEDIQEIMAK